MRKAILMLLLVASCSFPGDWSAMSIGGVLNVSVGAAAPSVGGTSLNSNVTSAWWVFQARDAIEVQYLGFAYNSRTGTPPTYRISIQGVTAATGLPDGTIKGASNNCYATFTPPADASWNATFRWVDLGVGNHYTTTRGELLAIVVDYSSGTADASNFSSIGYILSNINGRQGLPYAGHESTKVQAYPVFGYASASASYGNPVKTVSTTAFSSNSSPDEYALSFTVPVSVCSTYKVLGAEATISNAATAKTVLVSLYSGTTTLQSVTFASDVASTVGSYTVARYMFDEATLSTLACGSQYRLAFAPQETTANYVLVGLNTQNAQDIGAWPGGVNWLLSTRIDSGAWTDTTTTRPLVSLIVADMTPPGGAHAYSF